MSFLKRSAVVLAVGAVAAGVALAVAQKRARDKYGDEDDYIDPAPPHYGRKDVGAPTTWPSTVTESPVFDIPLNTGSTVEEPVAAPVIDDAPVAEVTEEVAPVAEIAVEETVAPVEDAPAAKPAHKPRAAKKTTPAPSTDETTTDQETK